LLSRCQVYVLESLKKDELINLVQNAIKEDATIRKKNITIKEYEALLRISGGDARKLLNLFELVVNSINDKKVIITDEVIINVAQQNIALYDKTGEQHYDIISAFIKSIRGSDPNAAVYWLARMIEGGEDPKFIARRLIISASEDIGNANPNALVIANDCFQAVSIIGMPEARIILAQTAIYLAASEKSNAAYAAINKAIKKVRESGNLPVPLHLRNAPTELMKELDYGKDYKYSHDYDQNFSAQEYLPEDIKDTVFYEPGNNRREIELKKYLKSLWGKKYNY
ncbi:MAG: replication-associated recombination protein A, partial [Bacteroidetes bacterium]|nr:replication-associated recombination protein A [Bacteroidota bacterium]